MIDCTARFYLLVDDCHTQTSYATKHGHCSCSERNNRSPLRDLWVHCEKLTYILSITKASSHERILSHLYFSKTPHTKQNITKVTLFMFYSNLDNLLTCIASNSIHFISILI